MRSCHCLTVAIPTLLLILAGACRPAPPPPRTLRELREESKHSPIWRRLDELKTLSLADAIKFAEAGNPDLEAALYSVEAAQMRYFQALGTYAPRLAVSGAAGQNLNDLDHIVNPFSTTLPESRQFTADAGATASWLIFDGFVRELRALAARRGERAAAAVRENVLRLLERAVAYAYYDILLADALIVIAAADVEFRKSCVAQAKVRLNTGFIAEGDYLGFRIDLNQALATLVAARNRRDVAAFALAELIGVPDGRLPERLSLNPLPTAIVQPPLGLDFYLSEALSRRPDLRELDIMIDIARYQELAGLGAFLPTVNAFAQFGFQHQQQRIRGYDDFNHNSWVTWSFAYGVEAEYLIFNGFARYNRWRELAALRRRSVSNFTRGQLSVLNEVESAFVTANANAATAKLYRESLNWVFTQRNLIAVEYWAGNVTITRLRSAQNDLVAAEGGFAVSLVELLKSKARLTAAVGGQSPDSELQSYGNVPFFDVFLDRFERNLP